MDSPINQSTLPSQQPQRRNSTQLLQAHIQVRNNVRQNAIQARLSRVYFIGVLLSNIFQFVPITVCLGLSYKDQCDSLMRVFLLLYNVLLLLNIVSTIHLRLHPLAETEFGVPIRPDSRLDRFMYHLNKFVESSFVLCFTIGAVSLFIDRSCKDTSPILYWTTFSVILYNLLLILLPLLLLTCLFCCLPCFIVVIRALYPEPNRGASEETIGSLPKYKYHTAPQRRDYGAIRIEMEDAVCSICLQEYTEGSWIRVLACRHHFHQRCADEWFRLQATCPLCVRPIDPNLQEDPEMPSTTSPI